MLDTCVHSAVAERGVVKTLNSAQALDSSRTNRGGCRASSGARSTVPQAAPVAAPVDLAPLVDHIASLEDRVQRLTEASTMWQIRAIQAEEKVKQLTAGDAEPTTRTDPQESPPAGQGEEIVAKEGSRLRIGDGRSAAAELVAPMVWRERVSTRSRLRHRHG